VTLDGVWVRHQDRRALAFGRLLTWLFVAGAVLTIGGVVLCAIWLAQGI